MNLQGLTRLQERSNFPLQDCRHYKAVLEEALEQVATSGQTILSRGVEGFEHEFATWLGGGLSKDHCIGVGNGTDALELAMHCAGVETGSAVVVPSLTAYATVAAILRIGAKPIFADLEPNEAVISAADVERVLSAETNTGKIRAVIAVHLYGAACNLKALREICSRYGVALIEDCAQATGTTYEGRAVGTWGDFAAFSFYPTKNLAALGDGGMLVVGAQADANLLSKARRLRFYGWNEQREAVQFGVNTRLDEIQAWILKGKLEQLAQQIDARRAVAQLYERYLHPWVDQEGINLPKDGANWQHSFHLYVITLAPKLRETVLERGKRDGLPYGVHYSLACHQHPYLLNDENMGPFHLPQSERMAASVLSLPLNPYLTEEDISIVCDHLHSVLKGN